jgi:hypothetical protein
VAHAAVVAQVSCIRRWLVLGENDFVVVCITLDEQSLRRHGNALRRLLSDNECFPTTFRTVGLLSDLGLTREAAELGCDVYVDDSSQAADVIRMLDDAWHVDETGVGRASSIAGGVAESSWSIRSRWMFGSPELPARLKSLVGLKPRPGHAPGSIETTSPHWIEGSSGDFGDQHGPP